MELKEIRKKLTEKRALQKHLQEQLQVHRKELNIEKKRQKIAEEGQIIITVVAKKTQDELEYRISKLVSMAMDAVTDDPYEFKLLFEMKRNKTECTPVFMKGKNTLDPMFGSGYGLVNVAALALRIALWNIGQPKSRNIICSDEPSKDIKTKQMHEDYFNMFSTLAANMKPKLQVIVIPSQNEEFGTSVADKIFKVEKINGISKVEEI